MISKLLVIFLERVKKIKDVLKRLTERAFTKHFDGVEAGVGLVVVVVVAQEGLKEETTNRLLHIHYEL